MKNSITAIIPEATIGLDLSDRTAQYCEINAAGEIVEEGKLSFTFWRRNDRQTARD